MVYSMQTQKGSSDSARTNTGLGHLLLCPVKSLGNILFDELSNYDQIWPKQSETVRMKN